MDMINEIDDITMVDESRKYRKKGENKEELLRHHTKDHHIPQYFDRGGGGVENRQKVMRSPNFTVVVRRRGEIFQWWHFWCTFGSGNN